MHQVHCCAVRSRLGPDCWNPRSVNLQTLVLLNPLRTPDLGAPLPLANPCKPISPSRLSRLGKPAILDMQGGWVEVISLSLSLGVSDSLVVQVWADASAHTSKEGSLCHRLALR